MTTPAEREAQPLAAFAMRSGEDTLPPGYMKQGDTIPDDAGNTVTVTDLAFKGYVKVWDNRTGVMSYQPRWLLWQTFQLKRSDGSFIFTDKDPHIPQNYGLDLVCLLHPDSPDFPMLSAMGFKPCLKHHTPTRAALDDHMKKTHKRAYAAMEKHLTTSRRDEDRALQMEAIKTNQQVLAALTANLAKPQGEDRPLYVSDKPKATRKTPRSRR